MQMKNMCVKIKCVEWFRQSYGNFSGDVHQKIQMLTS